MSARIQGTRYTRQLVTHRLLAPALRANPALLNDARVRDALARSRTHFGGLCLEFLDRWAELISECDVDAVLDAVLAEDADGQLTRTTSPLAVLLTEQQRMSASQIAATATR